MVLRKLKDNEKNLLRDFLYEAIFIPEGVEQPAKGIIEQPELRLYYEAPEQAELITASLQMMAAE